MRAARRTPRCGWCRLGTTRRRAREREGARLAAHRGRIAARLDTGGITCKLFLAHGRPSTEVTTPGDRLLAQLAALASPHRLRIVAALVTGGRRYVSQLARDVGLSRPLLQLHLRKLEEAGLVTSHLAQGEDGKLLNWYEAADFALVLDPQGIAQAARTLSTPRTDDD
jgi:DNA-binding transcriptional ArsR family regulator